MTHALDESRADAKKPYGEKANYADPGYQSDGRKRYPLDSEAHCRAAWSYVNMPKNAAKYTGEQLAAIKGRIKSAAKRYGIEISAKPAERKYDPGQLRDPHSGEWATGGGAIGHLIKSLVKVGGGDAFSPHDSPDSSLDWSAALPDGGRTFEVTGDDGDTVNFDLSHAELSELHAALTQKLSGDDGPDSFSPGGDEDPRYVDWSSSSKRFDGTAYEVEFGTEDEDGESVTTTVEMYERDMRDWHTQLTITLLTQGAEPPAARSTPYTARRIHRRAAGPSTKARTNSSPQRRSTAVELCTRAFAFEFETRNGGSSASDGRLLEGYAAVFNTPARIRDLQGDFDETIAPGAFKRSIGQHTPVLQFDHGKDPAVGGAPIGTIEALSEDSQGLHVRARLFTHPAVERVREAIAGKAIRGMSFRFGVPDKGDVWSRSAEGVDTREIRDADIHELGPVVFPAYDATSVSVRSLLSGLSADETRELLHELAGHLGLAVDLQDLTGQPSARSAGGGEHGTSPGVGRVPATPSTQQLLDDGTLRLKGILT
jgi:HK97 family phage prohead protease